MDFTLLFMYFITVNKYRFCISVIRYINKQIIGIGYKKKQYRSITNKDVIHSKGKFKANRETKAMLLCAV